MTLHEYADLEQGTEEWHAARRGMVTASAIGQLITAKTLKPAANDVARGLTASLVAEQISGYTEQMFTNDDMQRGIDDEPRARDLYSEKYAPVRETGFMVRQEPTWTLGFSPDGVVGEDGLIEVKSRRGKKQLATILSDAVPAENMAQIQAGLLVTGRDWCDYLSYAGGWPMYVKRVLPDPAWFEAIIAAAELFESTAAQMTADYMNATKGLHPTERPLDLEMSF